MASLANTHLQHEPTKVAVSTFVIRGNGDRVVLLQGSRARERLAARNLIEHSDEHLTGKPKKGKPDDFFDLWQNYPPGSLRLKVGPYEIQLEALLQDARHLADQLGKAVSVQLALEGIFAELDDAIAAIILPNRPE